MTISVKIIADSVGPNGIRLTTMQLRYPRFIHAEFMTHRVFSRNASSSRAIPVERLIQDVINDTAMPVHWGRNQPGMQADEECTNFVEIINNDIGYWDHEYDMVPREAAWNIARDYAISMARRFDEAGYHKQIVNRLLEPFSHINVVVTSTEWENFYELRRHKDAQPEIRALADAMYEAQQLSVPTVLAKGEWHMPYVSDLDAEKITEFANRNWLSEDKVQLACSVARCARVSYLTHDGQVPSVEKDMDLFSRLVNSKPIHASPAEHQAMAIGATDVIREPHRSNLRGWFQYRKVIETTTP